jgi:signal transduction histidine kinase
MDININIKNRLVMNAGISVFFVVILFSLGLMTTWRIAEISKKHELVDHLRKGMADLNIVTYEYLLHHEQRMEQQWNLKYNSLAEILDETEEETFKLIRADFIAIDDIFSQVTTNYKKRQKFIQKEASQRSIDAATEIEERLVAKMLITSHSIITSTSRIAEALHAEETKARKLAANLTLILIIVLAITVTTSSLLVARSISNPMNELIKGIEIIGEGNLKHKIDIKSKDEIGELTTAFNKMTANLKVITASRDELNQEISERKRVEEELEKYTMELEAANKDLEAFSYSVSHDLRAPLRAIDSFSKILLEEYNEKLDKEGQRILKVITDNTQKMGKLIEDILTLSRLGRKAIKFQTVNINQVVQDIQKEIIADAPGRTINWQIKKLPSIKADLTLIRQVFINLLSNAVKFTSTRETAEIEISSKTDGDDETILYVEDNGVGFNMEYVDKIFEVFQRLHNTEEFRGTGVGLAIVKRIIQRHGGRVWAEAKKDKGAKIFISLPKKDK